MKRNVKVALLCLASGAVALASGGCGFNGIMQFFGDFVADQIFLRGIN
jgi:hypothetical protein